MDPEPLSLSVVIPAYNEESRLGTTLAEVQEYLSTTPWSWEIRVVDDGSSDRTCAVVEEYAVRYPCIALQREPHRGKGGAVRAGVLGSSATRTCRCQSRRSRDSCRRS